MRVRRYVLCVTFTTQLQPLNLLSKIRINLHDIFELILLLSVRLLPFFLTPLLCLCHQSGSAFFPFWVFFFYQQHVMSFKSAESVDAMIGRLILCLACNLCCSSDVHNKLPQGISVIMQWQHSAGITISLTMLQLCVCVCARVCVVLLQQDSF